MNLDTNKIREDFAIYKQAKPPIYMDSACVTLKPRPVLDAMKKYYDEYPACGGRSSHSLGQRTTEAVESARRTIKGFINAKSHKEIIFTKNTTEALNLVAQGLKLEKGDTVLISDKEHNSLLIPFQLLREKGVKLKFFTFGDLQDFQQQLTPDVKLVATAWMSNVDGSANPVREICHMAHRNKSLVLIDGAQAASHETINVKKLDIDFLAFSGHKMFGPSGTGALYGKSHLLEKLNPLYMGGSTVKDSTQESFIIEDVPQRFEAGLQDYAGIIGFAAATEYITKIGQKRIQKHLLKLNEYLSNELAKEGITILGPKNPGERGGIISFLLEGIDSHEVMQLLNSSANIMIRSGVHCAHSWFNKNNIEGSARISLSIYNTTEECETVVEEIRKIRRLLA